MIWMLVRDENGAGWETSSGVFKPCSVPFSGWNLDKLKVFVLFGLDINKIEIKKKYNGNNWISGLWCDGWFEIEME